MTPLEHTTTVQIKQILGAQTKLKLDIKSK